MKDLTKKAQEIVEKTGGFITNNNYKVLKVSENYCELKGLLTDTSINHLNIAHGGYIFGLADTCAGIAAMTDFRTAVTIDSNITYLKPAKGKYLKAIAKPLNVGKKISMFEVYIYNDKEELIAKANVNYCYIDK